MVAGSAAVAPLAGVKEDEEEVFVPPLLYIDGPFGAPTQDFEHYKVGRPSLVGERGGTCKLPRLAADLSPHVPLCPGSLSVAIPEGRHTTLWCSLMSKQTPKVLRQPMYVIMCN